MPPTRTLRVSSSKLPPLSSTHSRSAMAPLGSVVGVLASLASFIAYASPIKTFWRIVDARSTEDFEGIPYVIGLLASLLWTYYGITKPGALLVATVNGAGAVLQAVYVVLFIIFAPAPKRRKTTVSAMIFDVVLLGGVVLTTQYLMNESQRLWVTGIICSFFCILLFLSPLAAMKNVINTKSVEYMPFFLSLSMFLAGGLWTLYGVLVKDIFIGVTSGVGFLSASVQLLLYLTYMNSKESKMLGGMKEEECQAPMLEWVN